MGTSARPVANAVIRIGARRSSAPRSTSVAAESHAFLDLQVAVVADQHDAVARRDADDRDESDQ